MKKFNVFAIFAVVALFAGSANAAEKYVAGGFEASGHLVTGMGFQATGKNGFAFTGVNNDRTSGLGVLGRYGVSQAAKTEEMKIFVDELQLNVSKMFGENFGLRSDISFRSGNAVVLEQAYATANIPVGNGLEFLVGRAHVPVGFESINVNENHLISQSYLVRNLRATTADMMKLYYQGEMIDFHFYLANALLGTNSVNTTDGNVNNDLPSVGMRLGYNWGDAMQASTIGLSLQYGSEAAKNGDYHFNGNIDWNWWATEQFAFGGELGYLYQDRGNTTSVMSGLLNLHYMFSDVWDGTLRYSLAWAQDTLVAGAVGNSFLAASVAEGQLHEVGLGGRYHLAEDAHVYLEARFDYANPKNADSFFGYGAAFAFAYNF